MIKLLCAVGVVPTRVYPQSGRISALAGRKGRLRACTEDFQPEDWQR
ncbi:replication protein RepA4 [Salmonella enterica]|nr:replication protein RepA4 [Salmonella enterica]